VKGRHVTHLPHSTNSDAIVALDEATGSLAIARHLHMPSEAQEGAEWALQALEDLSEDIRARKAGCIAFAGDIASRIVADSESAPSWSLRMHLRCEDLAGALNAISAKIRPATTQPMSPPSPSRQRKQQRRPSIATLEQAKKSGVTSITMPDGTTYTFGEPHADAVTPLEQWRRKRRGQS